MGTVTIREFRDMARAGAGGSNIGTGLLRGILVTDIYGLTIKQVTTIADTPVDSPKLTAQTHFVEMEADADLRYAVRPKSKANIQLKATAQHIPLPAGVVKVEAVYPGAVISFLQTSAAGGVNFPFYGGLIPILGL